MYVCEHGNKIINRESSPRYWKSPYPKISTMSLFTYKTVPFRVFIFSGIHPFKSKCNCTAGLYQLLLGPNEHLNNLTTVEHYHNRQLSGLISVGGGSHDGYAFWQTLLSNEIYITSATFHQNVLETKRRGCVIYMKFRVPLFNEFVI